ncbi:MAG: glucokinase, partial [Verrucomicrobiota bacterium]
MAARPHLILAGDIGGTKSHIALFNVVGGKLSLAREQRYPSTGYPGLNAILREFLAEETQPILAAGFGIPGV